MRLPGYIRLGRRGRDIQVLEGGAITLGRCADGARGCGRAAGGTPGNDWLLGRQYHWIKAQSSNLL